MAVLDIVTPGSYHHHCKEIRPTAFLYSEVLHTKPDFVYTSAINPCRNFEKLLEFPFKSVTHQSFGLCSLLI